MSVSAFSLSLSDWFVGMEDKSHILPVLSWDSPTLVVSDVSKAIYFYEKVFGFLPVFILPDNNHTVTFARMRYRGTFFVLTQDDQDITCDRADAATPPFYLYVDDVDTVLKNSVVCGAKTVELPHTDFFGDNKARLVDIFGYVWDVADKK